MTRYLRLRDLQREIEEGAARPAAPRLSRLPERVRHARDLLTHPENTVTSIAKLLGVLRNTIYNYVP